YMRGPTLLEAIAERGRFSSDAVRALVIALLDALHYLHNQDPPLVHGDLSPENIVLLDSGRIGLIDFGAIRVADPRLAAIGPPVGKELYAPPEQRRGEIHPASDLYALGVCTLYMVAGRHPRELFDHEAGRFQWDESGLSPLLNTVIRRLIALDIRDRFSSALEALDALNAARPVEAVVFAPGSGQVAGDIPPFSQIRAPYHAGGGPPPAGKPAWRYKVGPLMSSPAVKRGVYYIGSLDRLVTAIDAYTGRLKWKFATKGSIASSPAVAQDTVLVGDEAGYLYAVEGSSGRRRWTFRTGSPVGSSPAVADGLIYFGTNDGYFYAIHQGGSECWRCISNLDDRIRSSPAISENLVIAGTHGGSLFAFDRFAGVPRWEFRARGAITVAPVVDGGRVYGGCRAGGFYGLDAHSGALLWEYQAPDAIDAAPAIASGRVYFGCRDGALYCLDASEGHLRWKFDIETTGSASPLSAIALVD
ncbi:MAG: PQQ-binding-like beta-propeller repeat protein, partial [Cyanobacteria bacterium REEB65]|nr:PQQ-binding-like beta-propeller repeat protein [Cyanobacteria bacterium REEB65]